MPPAVSRTFSVPPDCAPLSLLPQDVAVSPSPPSASRIKALMSLLFMPLQSCQSAQGFPQYVFAREGSLSSPWVQCVIQAVTEEVEGQDGQKQRRTGEEHEPPGGVEDLG